MIRLGCYAHTIPFVIVSVVIVLEIVSSYINYQSYINHIILYSKLTFVNQ